MDNVAIDVHDGQPIATLIDVGLATRYRDQHKVHIKSTEKTENFQGNIANSSVDAMNFFKTSRKDDLISLFLMVVSLLNNNQLVGEEKDVEHLIKISESMDDTSEKETERIFKAYRDFKQKYSLMAMADLIINQNSFLNHSILELSQDEILRDGERLESKYNLFHKQIKKFAYNVQKLRFD